MKNIIPNTIFKLNELFKINDKKLFVVGGSIRDFIIGEDYNDFDIATDAKPDEIVNILSSEFKFNLQGAKFGVVVVYSDDNADGFEIATFRKDIYDDMLGISRNPDIEFSDIEGDAQRRDLTINSLYYDIDSDSIIDLNGGISDIENKICRFIGDSNLRIQEDPLRMLRLFRYSCKYDFEIDKNSFNSVCDNIKMIKNISNERIYDEFKKAYKQSKSFHKYLSYLYDSKLIYEIFNKFDLTNLILKDSNFEQTFAYMLKDNDLNKIKYELNNLKFSLKNIKNIIFYIELISIKIEDVVKLHKLWKSTDINIDDIKDWSIINSNKLIDKFTNFEPSIKSEDLISKGFKGKDLGIEINRLEIEEFRKIVN